MANHDHHLREKAIRLRTEQQLTLDDIVARLQLPRTTVYYWIKDIPIPFTRKQSEAQRKGTLASQAKYAAIREAAYQQGLAEAPELLQDPTFRDFLVMYMAEGYKRNRNQVALGNSDPAIVKLAHHWMRQFSSNKFDYRLQCHIDHDEDELKRFWSGVLGVEPEKITVIRKSNSGKLSGRQFRSVHGVLSVRVGDTDFRARLQAWIDYVKKQW